MATDSVFYVSAEVIEERRYRIEDPNIKTEDDAIQFVYDGDAEDYLEDTDITETSRVVVDEVEWGMRDATATIIVKFELSRIREPEEAGRAIADGISGRQFGEYYIDTAEYASSTVDEE